MKDEFHTRVKLAMTERNGTNLVLGGHHKITVGFANRLMDPRLLSKIY